jgi:hypothetical protein
MCTSTIYQAWADKKLCEGHEPERRFLISDTDSSVDQQCKEKRRFFISPHIKEAMNDRNFDDSMGSIQIGC